MRTLRAWMLLLVVGLTAAPVQSAVIDKYLPEDTEFIFTVNFRQIIDSDLFKKYALEPAKEALKDTDMVSDVLKDLGFDPFKDLNKLIVASPGGNDQDKGLIIVHGRFDLDKFKAKGEEAAKGNPEILKIHKVPGTNHVLYEVTLPEVPTPLFVALATEKTLLLSPGKDYIVDALKGKDKPVLKNKEFQAVLEKMDPKQSLSLAVVRSAWDKTEIAGIPGVPGDALKDGLNSLEALGGGITISDDINLELVGSAKTAKAAKELNQKINDGLNLGLGVLGLAAAQTKELTPLIDVVKSIKSTARDKTITLKAQISADLIEKALKKE